VSTPPAAPTRRGRTRKWRSVWRVARYVIGLVLAGFALDAVFGQRNELSGAGTYLNHVHWVWIAVAVVSEILCLIAYGMLLRRLLAAGRMDVSAR